MMSVLLESAGTMPTPGKRAVDCLNLNWPKELAKGFAREAESREQERSFQTLLPPELRADCRLEEVKKNKGTVIASSSAHGFRLRTLIPELLADCARIPALESIKNLSVKIVPELEVVPLPRKDPLRLPSEHAVLFRDLASELGDSPLRAALERLASRGE